MTILRENVNFTEIGAITDIPNKDDHIYLHGVEYLVVAVLRDYDTKRITAFVHKISYGVVYQQHTLG